MAPTLSMSRFRAGLACTLGLSLALGAASCRERPRATASRAQATPVRGGTLVIDGPTDLDMTNSLVTGDVYTQEVDRYLLFMPLVEYTRSLGYEPYLASSWTTQGDTAIVFQLRHDVRWTDGRPVTAYDVAFTFDRLKNPRTAFPSAADFDTWTSAVALDSFTVRMRHKPDNDPLSSWATMPIMPRHLLDSIPPERLRQAAFNRRPVGDGPFRFVSETPNSQWVFEANPDFPSALGRPYLQRVVWRVVPEATAQITDLRTGQAEMAIGVPADQVAALDSAQGVHALVRPSRKYAFIGWNGRRPPLNDAAVRRALTMAINRQRILDVLRAGKGTVAAGPVPPFYWAYDDSIKPLPYDTAQAQRLLAEAGYRTRNGNGVLVGPHGRPLVLGLLIPANNAFNRDAAEMIRSDLARVGVKLNVRALDFSTLISMVTSPARRFDGVLLAWEAEYRLNLRELFHSSALNEPFQLASYSNPVLDQALDSAGAAPTRAAALPWWHKVQRILRNDEPWSFLFYYPDIVGVSDRLKGVEMDLRGNLATIRDWWLTPQAGGGQ